MTTKPIRTRIAPSPTGFPHVGTAYIALFNMVFAKSQGGEFILRIEDTDQVRSTDQSEQMILNALKWAGLTWSEGPDVGGAYAPYRQSERSEIYKKYANELLDKGHAFRCFCTTDELDQMRREQEAQGLPVRYDGRYANLSREDSDRLADSGKPFVIRMRVPTEGECVIDDMLRGKITIPWQTVDMQVLLKADGLPTYHLANVVDDHLMQISHVIRGEEWINSAPKHKLLYEYFGWDMPVLCHMPLLRNPDKSKLSKRKNPTSITYYKDVGVLPEALINYLGRMGYSLPSEAEKFSLDEMIKSFDIKRVSLGGPVFDIEKLYWLNGEYLRAMSPEQLKAKILAWASDDDKLTAIAKAIAPRINVLSDAVNWAGFYFQNLPNVRAEDFTHKSLDDETLLEILYLATWQLEALSEWSENNIYQTLKGLASHFDIKLKDFMQPFFVAIAGSTSGTPIMNAMYVIGADMTLARLRHACEVLGGFGKKKLKKLEEVNKSLPNFLDEA
ncbi:glutamate--tRNA ligase [Moraxella nonliquefaciens]|uniref:Glutamate--tRNA ligase n=1 Tax=Moraxella nonliquefaciens TaxID=478 RepID=A0A1B8QHL1_MORNO|nr:glutamate--tRNA ligase [Moraxella nonliquefaciens]OBX82876.1 glutamate--tRNA ligase [Moraxella nonliquefaciens]QPT45056.1 glutamate--tRNA ligase [Moraxella nonliquefaciens]QQC30087.1 glutamate--tRNA ligase [Moraxella nonliquefaciens]